MTKGSTLAITVAKTETGFTASVLPGNSLVKDQEAKNKFVPICVSGTAEEMDEGFIGAILKPVEKASGLLSTIKDFEASQEAAKAASAMEKALKEESKKASENFNAWLAIAEQNFKENKFKDALTCLEGAEKLAANVGGGMAKVDTLKKKVKEALGEGTMFGAATEDMSDGKNVKPGKAAAKPAAAPAPAAQKVEEPETTEEENEEE